MDTKDNKNRPGRPLFADVVLTDLPEDGCRKNSGISYHKLIYPNGVSLVLPGNLTPSALMEYVKAYRP